MNIKQLKFKLLVILLFLMNYAISQNISSNESLDVSKAIEIGLQHNKKILQDKSKLVIAESKRKDLGKQQLPSINFMTDFNVLGDLHQFEQGITERSTQYALPRVMYDFTLSAEIPIYMGGRIINHKKIAAIDIEKQEEYVKMDERKIRLQIITAFLQVKHLQEQQILILEKMHEDSANVNQVLLFQSNGLVTDNEVLRFQLQLSTHKMLFSDLEKEIEIIEEKLKPLLGIEEDVHLKMLTDDILQVDLRTNNQVGGYALALQSNENLHIFKLEHHQVQLERKLVQANVLPSVVGEGFYGYSYPNFKFFPPEAFIYRWGMVGVKLNMPIGNLYKNSEKKKMADEKITLSELEVAELEEDIKAEVYEAQKKFEQAIDKIEIAQEAIEQAKENYRIVQTKYANHLSLITELIDADNAYLEARSNLISLSIDKQLKYYQLHYRLGNI